MVFQALAIGLLGPSGVSKGRCRFENRYRPLETFGGAHWAVPKSDDHPAPHFMNFQFATLRNRRRPLKSRWAEQLAASMQVKNSGPHVSVKF